jgi:hypothetical protein
MEALVKARELLAEVTTYQRHKQQLQGCKVVASRCTNAAEGDIVAMPSVLYLEDVGSGNHLATTHHQLHFTHRYKRSHHHKLIAVLYLEVVAQIEVAATPEEMQYLFAVHHLSVRLLLQNVQQAVGKWRSIMD